MKAATAEDGADTTSVGDGFDSIREAEAHPDTTPIGTRFYAVGGPNVDLYTLSGEEVATGARWVRGITDDPRRVIVGDEDRACEVIAGSEHTPQAVYRLDGTNRWDDFGEDSEAIGVGDSLYLPTEPEYEALRKRIETAGESSGPPTGRVFGRDVRQVLEEPISPAERDTCVHCDSGADTRVRIRAWRGDILFGIGVQREEIVNEVCPRCIELDTDAGEVVEYFDPDDPGEFPLDFGPKPDATDQSGDQTPRWQPLDEAECPDHPSVEPRAELWAHDDRLDGGFTVYNCDENGGTQGTTRLLVAELYFDGVQVGGETATFDDTPVDDIFRQAKNIYASYWGSRRQQIDWDEFTRID